MTIVSISLQVVMVLILAIQAKTTDRKLTRVKELLEDIKSNTHTIKHDAGVIASAACAIAIPFRDEQTRRNAALTKSMWQVFRQLFPKR